MKEKKQSDSGGATRLRPPVMRRGRPSGSLRSQRQRSVPPPARENPRCFYEVVADSTTRGSLDDRKLRLTRRILFLGRRWRNLMDEALRSTGDSYARWVTLLWVDMMAGRANLGELAEQIAVELPTLVRLLNRLERERIVERRALGGSNREKTVVLTVKGKRALAQMTEVITDTRRKFLADVDEHRIDAALELLDDLLAKYAHVVVWPGNAG